MPDAGPRHENLATRALKYVAPYVKTGDPAATLDRFFDSRHVNDLRTIIFVAFLAVVAVLVIGLGLSIEKELNDWHKLQLELENQSGDKKIYPDWHGAHVAFAIVTGFLSFFAPVLAAFGAVVAWAYQTGSTRLGVVDLFACEIGTLCRVGTVLDTVTSLIDRFGRGPPGPPAGDAAASGAAQPRQFTSQEDYFPVFGGNTKDLQALEANVVINITAFYTYMKAVRDTMRVLPEIRQASNDPAARDAVAARWHQETRNVIYLIYLGFESARKAIGDLVEFEPDQAERTIVVLISELAAYRFLRNEFRDTDDTRCRRLNLRDPGYQQLVPELCAQVTAESCGDQAAQWEPAFLLLDELRHRFDRRDVPIEPAAPPTPRPVAA